MLFAATGVSFSTHAWQLQPLELESRVEAADVIVLGPAESIVERTKSNIPGTGDVLTVKVRTSGTLKGKAEPSIFVQFAEIAVQTPPAFRLGESRIWLLKKTDGGSLFIAPSTYESVLLPSAAEKIKKFMDGAQLPGKG